MGKTWRGHYIWLSPRPPVRRGVHVALRNSICIGLSVLVGVLVSAGPVFAATPQITEESVVNVSSTSATLRAEIDSEGESGVTYRFEYGAGQYSSVGEVSASVSAVGVSTHLQGLSPDTAYSYRVVIQNHAKEVFAGEARSFTTRDMGGGFALPDGRMWEMVSPQNKRGAEIEPSTNQGGLIQAAVDGSALTYISVGPVEGSPAGNTAIEYSQIFSTRRSSGGWESRDIATPHNAVSMFQTGSETEYLFFSDDLSQGLVDPEGETPLPPLEEGAEKTVYVRNDATCASSPGTCFLPLVTKLNVRPGAVFGPTPEDRLGLQFAGATADLSHVVLSSPEALTAEAVKDTEDQRSLYEWKAEAVHPDEQLQLVSILPSPNAVPTTAEGEEASLGYLGRLVRNAISDDGSRIVWEAGVGSERHLYLRDMTKGETVQLDAPQAGVTSMPGEADKPIFQGASNNGSKVFFTDERRLTPNSHAEKDRPDLYVFEVNDGGGPLSGTLTDLTADENGSESAAVQGLVLGTSEDGAYVYFVANGALTKHAVTGNCTEGGKSGLCNLYMVHYNGSGWERPVLVAVLSNEDEADWGHPAGGDLGYLGAATSRVSPNGEYLAFMSDRGLTGYDNSDASSGVPDEEVYVYHAMHGPAVCASCDPTGARPVGVFDPGVDGNARPLLVDHLGAWTGHWLAGSVPGWTPIAIHEALYQSRYLSNDGRLFFDSPDTLVSADTNGEENVYEYEPDGVGSCSSRSASASEVFEADADGCVALISSGGSSEESAFLDASESGGDVFFLTLQELSVDDVDSALDVYDAHECVTQAPCASAPVVSPPCTTAESCRGAPVAQPSIFGAGGSATFSGAGNLSSPVSDSGVGRRSATRAQKLARALRACKRIGRRQRRASCVRRAERRYGRGK
jgi:hypothetical protein